MGGTFGEVSGAKLVGLVRAARDNKHLPQTILLLLDSGGVRLQEANAGELAVAELMRAIVQARCAGVAVIALVGGKAGAFGGAGLTAGTCSHVVVSEQGRIGVTGPEVIETNKGVEEYDSRDKALVWSVCGGKNRRLLGLADAFTDDTMDGFPRRCPGANGSVQAARPRGAAGRTDTPGAPRADAGRLRGRSVDVDRHGNPASPHRTRPGYRAFHSTRRQHQGQES